MTLMNIASAVLAFACIHCTVNVLHRAEWHRVDHRRSQKKAGRGEKKDRRTSASLVALISSSTLHEPQSFLEARASQRSRVSPAIMLRHGSNVDHDGAEFYVTKSDTSFVSRFSRFSRLLINSIRNHFNPVYHPLPSSSSTDTKDPGWVQMVFSVVSAPRFRRFVVVYLILFLLGWAGWVLVLSPRLQEREHLLHSLDPNSRTALGGWFGTNSLPRFDDLPRIGSLDPSLVPGAKNVGGNEGLGVRRRLVIVGDVHGCKEECMFCFHEVRGIS